MPRIATVYNNDFSLVPFDFPQVVETIAPRPLFVNAPLSDSDFDPAGVDECVNAAAPIYALLGAPNAIEVRHPATSHDFPADVREEAYLFIDRYLK
jgi:hypothetical protein